MRCSSQVGRTPQERNSAAVVRIARVKATHIDWPAIIRTFIASHPKAIKRNATLVKFLAELEKAK